MRFDPELGRYTRQHIYGEGMMDVFKSFGSKLFGKTMKKAAKKGVEKKAGDKIVQMLGGVPPPKTPLLKKLLLIPLLIKS